MPEVQVEAPDLTEGSRNCQEAPAPICPVHVHSKSKGNRECSILTRAFVIPIPPGGGGQGTCETG